MDQFWVKKHVAVCPEYERLTENQLILQTGKPIYICKLDDDGLLVVDLEVTKKEDLPIYLL